jgi:Tol biopolymer transport system component
MSAGWYLARQPAPAVVRFPIPLGADQTFTGLSRGPVAISPDGTQLAYVADRKLFRRTLSDLEAHVIVNVDTRTGAATSPAFSPDGRSVAYVTDVDKTLRRVAVEGGTPVTIAALDAVPFGVNWDAGGILFEADGSIMRVSADGGKPETLIAKSTSDRHRSPQMLPDGRAVMFTVVDAAVNTRNIGGAEYPSRIVAQSTASGERHVLIEGVMEGRYLPAGLLAYVSHNVLFAVPFDLQRLKLTGGPVPLIQGVRSGGGTALYAVSATGSLAYVPGTESGIGGEQNLGFVDRTGKVDFLKLPPATYLYPRLSPDGQQLAVEIDSGNDANISIYDLSGRTALRRLTFGGHNRVPAWSGDGQRLAFQSDRDGDLAIFAQRADGAGSAERLTTPEKDAGHVPESWSAKGMRSRPGKHYWSWKQ